MNYVKQKVYFEAYSHNMTFRENLKAELAYRGMLVKELAALSGISRHTLDNYLNVRGHIPSADIAVKIAQILEVSVEYLVTGHESRPQPPFLSSEMEAHLKTLQQLSETDRKMIYSIAQLFKKKQKKRCGS
jgi:transcriptional regulator with XRE-family HTH domain